MLWAHMQAHVDSAVYSDDPGHRCEGRQGATVQRRTQRMMLATRVFDCGPLRPARKRIVLATRIPDYCPATKRTMLATSCICHEAIAAAGFLWVLSPRTSPPSRVVHSTRTLASRHRGWELSPRTPRPPRAVHSTRTIATRHRGGMGHFYLFGLSFGL